MNLYVDIEKKIEDFNLKIKIESNENMIALLGASGSGKSLTLKCIAGIVKPDRGIIKINGKILFDSEKKINVSMKDRKIGFLFQNYALFPHMNVEKNLLYGIVDLNKKDSQRMVNDILKKLHLEGFEKKYPSQLSGGQQQRVALGRILCQRPEMIILDEPFSALDNHLKNSVIRNTRQDLAEFCGQILIVTHSIEEAYAMGEDIAIIQSGLLAEIGKKESVLNQPKTIAGARAIGVKNIAKITDLIEGRFFIEDWNFELQNFNDFKIGGYVGIKDEDIEIEKIKKGEKFKKAYVVDCIETLNANIVYFSIGKSELRAKVKKEIVLKKGEEIYFSLDNSKLLYLKSLENFF